MKVQVNVNKMDMVQFGEWVERALPVHGEVAAVAVVKRNVLHIELKSKDIYALEDAKRELDYIAANGY